jgi:hypothetical protein
LTATSGCRLTHTQNHNAILKVTNSARFTTIIVKFRYLLATDKINIVSSSLIVDIYSDKAVKK